MSVSGLNGDPHTTDGRASREKSVFASAESPGLDGGLRIGVLGPLIIVRDGTELRARPAGERSVLGLLVLCEGSPVPLSKLVATLWPDDPPTSSAATVQTYISRLRKALGWSTANSRERLSRDSSGYRLDLAESEVDLALFRRLLGDARAARASGDLSRACESYSQSLGLWYGEPFADVDALRGHSSIVYLMQERNAAILEYAEVALGAGWHARVLPHLRALVSREPFDEFAHAHLMIALAGTGRQGEALNLYEALRLRLDQQLGVYPGPALQDAQARILRQEIPPARADPDAQTRLLSVRPDGQAERWTGIPARLPVCQLPPSVSDFTGRKAESRMLAARLAAGGGAVAVPIAVISGAPGVGKTALALHIAHSIRGSFPDGQLFVQMAGNSQSPRDPAEVLGELLPALGMDGSSVPESDGGRTGLFRSLIAGRQMLVILDDAAAANQIRPLLPGTAGSAVLVTARSRLGALAGAHLLHLDPLPVEDAMEMLCRIVGRERLAADPAASGTLISACGRLPLALRIVGAKLATRPSWPVGVVAKAVADERRRLDELVVDDLAVRASIRPSYEALDRRERQAFARLGLLGAADFAEWVIAALIGEPEASAVVGVLVNKSLLTMLGTDGTGEPRYGLHDLLRDYAVEKVNDESEDDKAAAVTRALTRWLDLAALADRCLPRVPAVLRPEGGEPNGLPETLARYVTASPMAWFSAERLNLAAAARQASRLGMYHLAGTLAARIATFQFLQARQDDAEQMWHLVTSAAKAAGDEATAARADLRFAPMLIERGKHAEAMVALNRCLRALETDGDEQEVAVALYCCAWCAEQQNMPRDARDYATRGLAIARRIEDQYTEISSLSILGLANTRLGDPDNGLRMCEEALTLARQMQAPFAEFQSLKLFAFACNVAREYNMTIDLCQQGLDVVRNLEYPVGEGCILSPLGDAYSALGLYDEAIAALSRAQKIFHAKALMLDSAISLFKLALIDQALGGYSQAIPKLKVALPLLREVKSSSYEEKALAALEHCSRMAALVLGRGDL